MYYFGLLLTFAVVAAERYCDNSLCNYEGICELQANGKSQCKCIGEHYFQGSQCEKIVDNCAQGNPCQNGAQCLSVLGGHICAPCPKEFTGEQCSYNQPNSFTKFYLHYNRLVNYGQPQKFLFTLETLGSVTFHTELYTSNCLVDMFTTFGNEPSNDVQWRKSNDLRGIARSLGLRHGDQLPYDSGYYHTAIATFWTVGETELVAVVSNKDITESIILSKFIMVVLKPRKVDCIPVLDFPLCSHPKKMLQMDNSHYNHFEATIVKRCHVNSVIHYHWRLYSVLGLSKLLDFENASRRFLKVPPFLFWFNQHAQHQYMYSLQLEAEENGVITVARCYITILSKPVFADIIGGPEREVNAAYSFIIDGSRSRDYTQPPNRPQSMDFHWDCVSETDPSNIFCRLQLSNEYRLRVPANSLKTGHTYSFTLTVNERMDIYNSNSRVQVIKTVAGLRPLHLAINCIRNCERYRYNPNQIIHLEAKCLSNDVFRSINYKWNVGTDQLSNSSHLIYTPTDVENLEFNVIAQNGNRKGKANIKLVKNQPPSDGTCEIQPAEGVEYQTEFKIKCTNFIDPEDDYPLTYEYSVNNFTLERTTDSSLNLRLLKTNTLKIIICDNFGGCSTTEVAVSVNAINIPQNVAKLKTFFSAKENNLPQLLKNENSEVYMLLIYILSENFNNEESAEYIWDQLDQLVLDCLLNVEQMMRIFRNFIVRLQPIDYNRAKLIFSIIRKLNEGMENIIGDGEVLELTAENYKNFTNQFAQTLYEFGVKLDQIPHPELQSTENAWLPNDPLSEMYDDMSIFDITVLPRINNWLHLYQELNKGLLLFGVLEAHMQLPGEPVLDVKIDKNFELQAFSIDDSADRQISIANSTAIVYISPELLDILQMELKSPYLLLQSIMVHSNPFWWYPDDTKLSTIVFFFSIFTPTSEEYSYLPLKKPFTFVVKRLEENITKPTLIHGKLKSYLYMSIYRIKLQGSSLLLVKFDAANVPLLVELELISKPRSYKVRRYGKIVPVGGKGTTFTLINEHDKREFAYIAVMSNNGPKQQQHSPITYSFHTEIRQCLYFEFRLADPRWSNRGGCLPSLSGHTANNIVCNCRHMSAFAGKILPAVPKMYKSYKQLLEVPINTFMITLCIAFLLMLLIVFVKIYRDAQIYGQDLFLIQSEEDIDKKCNIRMRIVTGTHMNDGTTANVSIKVLMIDETPKHFIIYQNPKQLRLKINTDCTLWLPLKSEEMASPIQINIRESNGGRFPSWFCEYIEIHDLKLRYIYHINVKQWIRQQSVQLMIDDVKNTAYFTTQRKLIKRALICLFAQWFLWQPLFGLWKCPHSRVTRITRYERSCIWLVRFCMSICIVACYFGPTTLETYEEERDKYHKLGIPVKDLICLCLGCYFVGFILQYILLLFCERKDE